MRVVGEYEEFFVLVVEAHILAAATSHVWYAWHLTMKTLETRTYFLQIGRSCHSQKRFYRMLKKTSTSTYTCPVLVFQKRR